MSETAESNIPAQPPRPNLPVRWSLVALSTIIVAVAGWLLLEWMFPEPPNMYRAAAELNDLIHRDPRFAEVGALCMAGKSVIVIAPDDLPPETKADLERFVRETGKIPKEGVRYLPMPPEHAAASPRAPTAR